MSKIKVAIFGAAGYAGEELLRILTRHRQCEIVAITSRKNYWIFTIICSTYISIRFIKNKV